jgi:hypothetical protein
MNDYGNYLAGINAVQSQPTDPGTNAGSPSFWSNLISGASRAGAAGGGIAGLAAALNPQFAASYNPGMQNRPMDGGNGGGGGNFGGTAGANNAAASQASSGALSSLGKLSL